MQVALSDLTKSAARESLREASDFACFSTIRACFEQVLRLDHVAPDDDFFELGGDSALALELALEIEAATGISLPMTAAFDAPTPAEMALLIDFHQGRQAGAPVLLRQGGADMLFLFPGAGGTAVGLRAFARGLRTDLSVYGFDTPGLNGRMAPLDRVEALSDYHLPRLREAQPHGPYRLAGYSVGGLVAYEIARRLMREGEQVELVGLIDTVVARAHYGARSLARIWVRRARRHWQVAREMQPLAALRYASARLRNVVPDIVPPRKLVVVRPGSVSDAGAEANRRYAPGRYDGRVVLLWSEAAAEHNSLDIVWRTRARRLEVYRLPGDHLSAMTRDVGATSGVFSAVLGNAPACEAAPETVLVS